MKNNCLKILFFSLLLIWASTSFAWECEVVVSGPGGVKLGQSITLSAEGTPSGGSYSWSRTPNLVPNGSTATLTGFKSDFSDYIGVLSYYTTPKGTSCSDRKWIWVCLCDVSIEDSSPDRAKVGEEVSLSASSTSTGGTYLWRLNSGTGSISGNGSSATFIGDQAGEVEVRIDYTPSEGGEPCKDFHTILVEEDCSVEVIADPGEVSLGGIIHLTVEGEPADGTWQWTPANGLVSGAADGRAVFTPPATGQHTLTVKYTPPGGQECEGDTTVSAYKVQSLISKNACFSSGDTLKRSDFDLLTTPVGYEDRISFAPATVSTSFQTQEVAVTGSCGDGTLDDAMTMVTVVNKNKTSGSSVEITIPIDLKQPLEQLGVAEELDFSFSNSYSNYNECCSDKVADSTSGKTSLILHLPTASVPIAGIPLPSRIKKFAKADISVDLTGNTNISVTGTYDGCAQSTEWTGGGSAEVGIALTGGVKAELPGVFIIGGEAQGSTSVTETLSMTLDKKLKIATGWGGLTGEVSGFVSIEKFKFKRAFNSTRTYFEKDNLLPIEFNFPTIKQ